MNIPPIFPYSWASDWGEDQYGLWMGLNHKGVHCVFRWIDPGTFMMGSPVGRKPRYAMEDYHQVTLTQGFWITETTVTQALWESVLGENPSHFKGESRPVETISWNDCQAFIQALNSFHSELKVRLPWEAEWEYACRAGTETPYSFGNDIWFDKANFRGLLKLKVNNSSEKWSGKSRYKDSKQATADVKDYPSNAWGLYEMHGNVWEWCQDHWQDGLGTEPVTDPKNAGAEVEQSTIRVVRGGSWGNDGRSVQSGFRFHYTQDVRNSYLGFRLTLACSHASSA